MMKKINILAILLAAFVFSACVEDESTEAVKPISEITIVEGSMQKVYNVNANETLTIAPQISQSNEQKPLQYSWEVDLEVVSREETFVYKATTLGSFNCRLIVENEDGKTFYTFKLNVNTEYEEGLTVISNDPEGNSCLSFMLTPTDGSDRKFYDGDCFSIVNADIRFASNVVDMAQCDKNLMLICQGSAKANDVPTIYYLNDKTFVVENMVEITDYSPSEFKPVRFAIPATTSFGTSYPILCENGKIYDFSAFERAVAQPVKMQSTYENACVVNTNPNSSYYDFLFWDKEAKGLALLYTGYGPFYCDTTYHATRADCLAGKNYYAGENFVAMTLIHKTQKQLNEGGNIAEMIVLTESDGLLNRSMICTSFHVYDFETGKNVLYDNDGINLCSVMPDLINATTPCIANQTYNSMLYAQGNKVMKWYYKSTDFIEDAKVLCSVGSDKAVITAFDISADHKQTYVSFYEPDQPGMNGSVWVFDTDKGTVLEQYNNVCYKPVKMIYKRK